MTHEIFLTAIVADADVTKARAILGGFTEMRERKSFTRVQHYEPSGDVNTKGLPAIKQLPKERTPTAAQWQELHQILVKQPCSLQVRTDIAENMQNGETAKPNSTSGRGLMRWTEFPEPTNARLPFLTQRKVIEISDPRTEHILADSKFRIVSNLVEESYHWWQNNVEYILTRSFILELDSDSAAPPSIPDLGTRDPVAPFWILYVRVRVESAAPATMPEHIRKAQAQLVQIRGQLMGVFDFRAFDRRCHDTRLQSGSV